MRKQVHFSSIDFQLCALPQKTNELPFVFRYEAFIKAKHEGFKMRQQSISSIQNSQK